MSESFGDPDDGPNLRVSAVVRYASTVEERAAASPPPPNDVKEFVVANGTTIWIGRNGHIPIRDVYDAGSCVTSHTVAVMVPWVDAIIEVAKGRFVGPVVIQWGLDKTLLDGRYTTRNRPADPYPDRRAIERWVHVMEPVFEILVPDLQCRVDVRVERTRELPSTLPPPTYSKAITPHPLYNSPLPPELKVNAAHLHFLVAEIFVKHYAPDLGLDDRHALYDSLTRLEILTRWGGGGNAWDGRAVETARRTTNGHRPFGLHTGSTVDDLMSATVASGIPFGLIRNIGDSIYLWLSRADLVAEP